MSPAPFSPASALLAHIERVLSKSRCLVIGSAENLLARHLLDRGARLVHVLDPDPRRVAHAAAHNGERRISYAQLTDASLRDGSFDCAIVEDLGTAAEPERLLLGLKRSLGHRGLAFICITNSERTSGLLGATTGSLGYARLEDLTTRTFQAVRLLGQTPFVGYAVVSLSLTEPPEPCLDNDFLDGEADQADVFIAICGSEEALTTATFEDMTIVQLPAEPVLSAGAAVHAEREQRARRRVENLEAELRTMRTRASNGEVDRLTQKLDERDAWIRELETRAAKAEARADDAQADCERLERAVEDTAQASQRTEELRLLKERLDDAVRVAARSQKEARWAEERSKNLERELEAALDSAEAAEAAVIEAAGPQATWEAQALEHQQETDRLRATLTERQAAMTALERELGEQERELEEAHRDLLHVRSRLSNAEASSALTKQELAKVLERPPVPIPQGSDNPAQFIVELQALEAQLQERGRAVLELQEQLRQLELLSRTLSVELQTTEGLSAEEPEPDDVRVDALAQGLAQREADLVAAEWTIGELRQRLASRAS